MMQRRGGRRSVLKSKEPKSTDGRERGTSPNARRRRRRRGKTIRWSDDSRAENEGEEGAVAAESRQTDL